MNIAHQPQTMTGSPVIDFAAPSANQSPRRRARVGKRPDHPDADLIEHCIEFAVQFASGEIAYKVDPTDSKFALFSDDLARSRADRAMRAILETAPATIDGIRAKAELVKIAIADWCDGRDDLHEQFLTSLADDIIRLQRHSRHLKTNLDQIVVPR